MALAGGRPPGTVWIADSVLARMRLEARRRFPLETGGVFMGYRAPSRRAVVVTHLVGAGPNAVHEPTCYAPDYSFQEREVARLHTAAQGKLLYLGDWHSHPAGELALSRADRRTLNRIACAPEAGAPKPLMGVFAGGGDRAWHLGVWQGQVVRTWMRRVLRTRGLVVVRFSSL